ncbi:MAG: MarR family transcriptional regulator [Phycisphaeraceae bacterium]|nr:MAG: MarR family transcriptional regulator [Phycisphaeraceae bacterium]
MPSRSRKKATTNARGRGTRPAKNSRGRAAVDARASLQRELHKKSPFASISQEAYIALQRTSGILSADFQRLLKPHGLSEATYNVLRILRGAIAEDGTRTCSEIGEHMVTPVPDVTRLIDRLEDQGLVRRARDGNDRRITRVKITRAGLDILAALDKPVLRAHKEQLGHVSQRDLGQLLVLLAKIRRARSEP